MQFKPFIVEVLRGNHVESQHTVIASVFSKNQNQRSSFGDDSRLIHPRSSLKPIQAIPLIITQAASYYNLGSEELAMACSSHRGEDFQIQIILKWMNKVGVTLDDFECGVHAPGNTEALYNLLNTHKLPSAIHNNCSGKHTGMMTTAIYLKEPTKSYVSISHPVQQRIKLAIETVCKIKLSPDSFGIDGCSIPAPSLPLLKLAEGYCEFIDSSQLDSSYSDACKQLYKACVTHPLLTAGNGHYCSEMMKLMNGTALLKGGAEGVMTGAIPNLKIGFALKALDGNSRATEFCTSILLNKLGMLTNDSSYLTPKITNWNHIETGYLRLRNSI